MDSDLLDKRAVGHKRILTLGLGTAALLFLGLVYAWSIFSTPLDRAYGWGSAALSLTFSLSMIFFCIGSIVSSLIMARTSPRVTIFAGGILMGIGFACTGILAPWGVWTVYVFYGGLIGLGCGFGYNSLIATVNAWFPDKIGFSSGVLLLGFGMGALILGSVADILMTEVGLTGTFSLLGVAAFLLLAFLAFAVRLPRVDVSRYYPKKSTGISGKGSLPSFKPRTMATSPTFALYLLWFVSLGIMSLTLIGSSKQGALGVGVDAGFATLLVGLVSTTNGVARLVFGSCFDHFGLTKSMAAISFCGLIAAGLLVVSFLAMNPAFYIAGAIVTGFSYGGVPVMSSSFAMARFGPKYYSTNFALANICIIPASLLSSALATPLRALGGDLLMYTVFGVIVAIGAGSVLLFARRYKRELAEIQQV